MGKAERKLRERLKKHTKMVDGCLVTFGFSENQDGRPVVAYNGKNTTVGRIVCEWEHGPPPDPSMLACHVEWCKCQPRCILGEHLYWGTHRQNMKDRRRWGKDNARDKFPFALRLMRDRKAGMTYKELGIKYGIGWHTARRICTGFYTSLREMAKRVFGPGFAAKRKGSPQRKLLTEKDVAVAKFLYHKLQRTTTKIAKSARFNHCSQATIENAINGYGAYRNEK